MPENPLPSTPSKLTSPVQLRSVEAVINAASGSVGANAGEKLEAITASFGLSVKVRNVQPEEIKAAIHSAVAAKPDLLIVVAGDGTAALAAELCGMNGPLVAPLAGGTMNMLPYALYGRRNWQEALTDTLAHGELQTISGGEISGRPFHVAAILGAPALWADAREAMRKRRFGLALLRARRALRRAFSGSLRFSLEGGVRRKAEALSLMCPLVSKAMDDDRALEAAALDPRSATDAFRLGFRALFGDWRNDPCVQVDLCTEGKAWARGRIPVLLDGEPHRMESPLTIRYVAQGFRVLAPPMTKAQSREAVEVDDDTRLSAAGRGATTRAAGIA